MKGWRFQECTRSASRRLRKWTAADQLSSRDRAVVSQVSGYDAVRVHRERMASSTLIGQVQ